MAFRKSVKLPIDRDLFISLISGSEAGIATTAAIIAGVVVGTNDRSIVIISSIVAIVVQAFNSSINLIYTAHTIDEIEDNKEKESLLGPLIQAGMQFLTHLCAGLVVLVPIVYVRSLDDALLLSVLISLLLLTWIGFFVGRTVQHTPLRNGIQSFLLGALIISGGFVAGLLIN